MEIIRIFEGVNNLFSFKFEEEELCEYDKIMESWYDIEFLENIFKKYYSNIDTKYSSERDIEQLVLETINLAEGFEKTLYSYEKNRDKETKRFLEELFEPLSVSSFKETNLRKSKSKKLWLRLYALRVDLSTFIITGGAIKLSQKMEDNELTKIELEKMNKCRDFLMEQGIRDLEQVITIL